MRISVLLFFITLFAYTNILYAAKPQLVVNIVVEQMRYDYIQRFLPHFSKGGFKKLMYEGVWCQDAHTNYAYATSASGIASISTGTTPSQHGIIGNSWYSMQDKTKTYSTYDKEQYCIGCKKPSHYTVSAKQLMASTLADELYTQSRAKANIYTIALDPQSAVLMHGKLAPNLYWLDDYTGKWVSSSAYSKQTPLWVEEFNAKQLANLYIQRTWNTLIPINYYEESYNDNCNFEIGIQKQTTFPYNIDKLKDSHKPYKILKQTPFGNTFLKDFAIEIIEKNSTSAHNSVDMLNIVFTATREIADRFGAVSKELQDTYIRLDYELMFFINYLEEKIGADNFLLTLTSTHGEDYSPKYEYMQKHDRGVFKQVESMYLLNTYLETRYGTGNWVEHYYNQQIYLNHPLVDVKQIPIADIRAAAVEFLSQLSGIHTAMSASVLQSQGFCGATIESYIDNAYNPQRSGDVFIQLKPYWSEQTVDAVATHNSAYSYDTHVPLFLYGAGVQSCIIRRKVNVTDIVPTLANIIGINQPTMANGNILQEVIK